MARIITRHMAAVVALLLAGTQVLSCSAPVGVGQAAPSFSLAELNGAPPVALSELRGRVVVLHFWATWCPPCLVELPGLLTFSRRLDPAKFAVLPTCVDDRDAREVRAFCAEAGFKGPIYVDRGGKLAQRYGTFKFPETYIIDARGVVCKKIVGPAGWSSPEQWEYLNTLSSQAPPHSP